MTPHEIEKEIKQLDPKKACVENLPSKMLISGSDIVSKYLSKNNTSKNGQKYPIHKEKERILLKNYKPVSLIPIVSKLKETCSIR